MTIVRINQFHAKEGDEDTLWELMQPIKETILSNPGSLGCQLLQNQDDPAKIVVIEQWKSVEAHQAATQKIPVHLFEEIMKLVAQRPSGAYYHE